MPLDLLLDTARKACEKAYAPYSQFPVGAALLTESGEVVTGVNIENVSYGLTICAERAAVAAAVSLGYRKFSAIAVYATARPNGHVTPCGACRQVLGEFMKPDAPVIMANKSMTLGDLLPEAFQ